MLHGISDVVPLLFSFGVTAEISGLGCLSRSSRSKFVCMLVLSGLHVAFGYCSTFLKAPIEIKIWEQPSDVSKRRNTGDVAKQLVWESAYMVCSL